jgi:AraC family transcriptional regulator of adaptative response/methylated-DNA-[protein]-cysteine methyltransferase
MSQTSYQLIEAALHYLDLHRSRQPSLQEVAEYIGLSEFHFQRLFTDWAGVSPKRFLQFLNREYLKTLLDASYPTLDATFEAGLSSTSRTHELFTRTEGITPAEYRSQGRNMTIHYGLHESPFGEYLLGVTDRGICHMAFTDGNAEQTLRAFSVDWSSAKLSENSGITDAYHEQIFAVTESGTPLPLFLRGTPFQLKVWEALLTIPEGSIRAYEDVADMSGNPAATRAAASAIAGNRIALLVPCHRVIRKIGETGDYRWGRQRKRLLLAWEAARVAGADE